MIGAPGLIIALTMSSGDSARILIPALLGLAGVYFLLPRPKPFSPWLGCGAMTLAFLSLGFFLIRRDVLSVETFLFGVFAAVAIAAAATMITQSNPVRAALSFALVVMSTCGLFLLQAAPFLMAATTIVYAGAIIVTFAFVIMLAQQAGMSSADARSREPFLACIAGFVLLASILAILQSTYGSGRENAQDAAKLARNAELSPPAKLPYSRMSQLPFDDTGKMPMDKNSDRRAMPAENVAYIGKTLFTDYLLAVELGGTLLLVATVGAIAITGRRSEESK